MYKIPKKRLGKLPNIIFDRRILIKDYKILKSEVLSNKIKAAIFKFIKSYPGINFSALKNLLLNSNFNVETGKLIWHLEILMNFEYINKMSFKNFTLYFPYEMAPEKALSYFLLRNKINRKIIKILLVKGSMKQADIPKVINESEKNVFYYIKIMVEEQLLIYEKTSAINFGGFKVRLNPTKKSLLIEIIESNQ